MSMQKITGDLNVTGTIKQNGIALPTATDMAGKANVYNVEDIEALTSEMCESLQCGDIVVKSGNSKHAYVVSYKKATEMSLTYCDHENVEEVYYEKTNNTWAKVSKDITPINKAALICIIDHEKTELDVADFQKLASGKYQVAYIYGEYYYIGYIDTDGEEVEFNFVTLITVRDDCPWYCQITKNGDTITYSDDEVVLKKNLPSPGTKLYMHNIQLSYLNVSYGGIIISTQSTQMSKSDLADWYSCPKVYGDSHIGYNVAICAQLTVRIENIWYSFDAGQFSKDIVFQDNHSGGVNILCRSAASITADLSTGDCTIASKTTEHTILNNDWSLIDTVTEL